jgi:bis(5'-nucleosyl)-tetraphosphatase (symmetrical)
MATWAIGDIQGCLEPLERLLKKIRFDARNDELWLVGDLVNRGPDSLGVMRRLYALRANCRVVLGNHDLHMLAVAAGAVALRRKDTFADVLGASDAATLLHWLQQQPLLHFNARLNTVMTHAGIPAQWSLLDAQRLANEVEGVLRHGDASAYFRDMYGNEPACWNESLSGTARLRVITNCFTRMRFVDAAGALDLTSKEGLGSAPAGYAPWFDAPARKTAGTRIVFGHWAALQGKVSVANVFALDSGCVWGSTLTAMNLESGQRVACDCTGIAATE